MKEQTGETCGGGDFMKSLFVAPTKDGKTCFAVASMLGVLPWQKSGGVVDKPENLHVVALDTDAVAGLKRFLVETCGAPQEALKFRVWNLEDDIRKVSEEEDGHNYGLYNTLLATISKAQDKISGNGVPAILFSSLTTLIPAIQRSVAGAPGQMDSRGNPIKSNMDQNKWTQFGDMVNEIRNYAQRDVWHCAWEAHILKTGGGPGKDDEPKEVLALNGSSGKNFPNNVGHVFRVRRMAGQKEPGTKCDKTFIDTRAQMEFAANGRNVNEALDLKEPDLTVVFNKLGYKTGNWNAK